MPESVENDILLLPDITSISPWFWDRQTIIRTNSVFLPNFHGLAAMNTLYMHEVRSTVCPGIDQSRREKERLTPGCDTDPFPNPGKHCPAEIGWI